MSYYKTLYILWGDFIKYERIICGGKKQKKIKFFPNSTFVTYVLVRVFFWRHPPKNIVFPPARHLFTIAYGKTPFPFTRKRCLAEVFDGFRHLSHRAPTSHILF